MSDILPAVQKTIAKYDLLSPGDAVVVGVSGGADSLTLLHVLVRLSEPYRLRLHVAHLHHGARGADADADAAYVAELAAAWGLPCTIERQDVPALARSHKLAFEEAARRVRYAFLSRVAGQVGATRIAVGHNADDQAETVLMHFLRGAGLAGLRGMLPLTPITDYRLLEPFATTSALPTAPCIIRPLLEIPRAAIASYCAEQGLTPRFDYSNLDTTYFRNRLRHELLPLLETYVPNVRKRLCHTAAVLAADYEVLSQVEKLCWKRIVRREEERAITFDRQAWQALPVAMQRATLRHAAYRLRPMLRDVDFVHVEQARYVGLEGKSGAQATLPAGLVLTVGYDTLTVSDREEMPPPQEDIPALWGDEPVPVQVPGRTPLPGSRWVLEATVLSTWDMAQIASNADPWTAYLDAEAIVGSLALRRRRPGDRFRPQGMEGHSVKLSAFLINLKEPRFLRDHLPLLVDEEKIVWVCGRRIAEEVAVRPQTRSVVLLQFIRSNYPAHPPAG